MPAVALNPLIDHPGRPAWLGVPFGRDRPAGGGRLVRHSSHNAGRNGTVVLVAVGGVLFVPFLLTLVTAAGLVR